MTSLQNKKIVVGVTGGIAAYKAVEVVSRLRKAGADVHVIMTKAATNFVTELTFREISGHAVVTSMWDKVPQFNVEHIALANLADMILIVPATANVIAKLANGLADDMLTTTVLATKAPVMVAPAMNTNMYENSLTQANIQKLTGQGMLFIEPASGNLACGISGKGRLPEPIDIVQQVADYFAKDKILLGRKIIVTAAGTIEPIDPVRYIGNHSTGRMGYAIAAEAAKLGAEVILVSGPSNLADPSGVTTIRVQTAREMHREVKKVYETADAVIMSAAVADYRPVTVATDKIKKSDDDISIKLTRNPDILFELGQLKKQQVLVGFAAETCQVEEYARRKLAKKNLDFIVANDVSAKDAGFAVENNRVKLIYRDGTAKNYPLMSKAKLAKIILEQVAQRFSD